MTALLAIADACAAANVLALAARLALAVTDAKRRHRTTPVVVNRPARLTATATTRGQQA